MKGLNRVIPRRKPLTNSIAINSALEWWNGVTKDPRFFDVLHAVRQKKSLRGGVIQETQHGQLIAAGYEAGYEDCAHELLNLSVTDMPETTKSEYAEHPDLTD